MGLVGPAGCTALYPRPRPARPSRQRSFDGRVTPGQDRLSVGDQDELDRQLEQRPEGLAQDSRRVPLEPRVRADDETSLPLPEERVPGYERPVLGQPVDRLTDLRERKRDDPAWEAAERCA